MKRFGQLLLFLLFLIVLACNTKKRPDIHFFTKFPEHNRNLTKALPDTFKIKHNTNDTVVLSVTFDKKTGINYIINIDKKDTLYEGYAAKYNGIYFLSRIINDSSYHIHAMHTDGYTIKGLYTEALQVRLVERSLNNELKPLIVSNNDQRILLSPKKDILYPYFKNVLVKLRGDTIIDYDLHIKKKGL